VDILLGDDTRILLYCLLYDQMGSTYCSDLVTILDGIQRIYSRDTRYQKVMQVIIRKLSINNFCLIDPSNDWLEGRAVNTDTNEIIYYNGDYGDPRPKYVKRLIAERHEIGFVQLRDQTIKEIKDAVPNILEVIKKDGGVCTLQNEKKNGKYIITLP
jgi:hypothetical protein